MIGVELHDPSVSTVSTPMNSYAPYAGLLLVLGSLLLIIFRRRHARSRYPPGPKGLPIVGNVRDVPAVDSHVVYREWSRIHSEPRSDSRCTMRPINLR